MEINLSLSELNPLQPMNQAKKRNLYTYQFLGIVNSLQKRTNPKHSTPFYQMNLNCVNNPSVKKIFVLQPKLKNEALWNSLETNSCLGQTYLFSCRNYRGSYYLIDWKEHHA